MINEINLDKLSATSKLEMVTESFSNMILHFNDPGRIDEEAVNISKILSSLYKYNFNVTVVSGASSSDSPALFVMSVYPEMSTVDKVAKAIMNKNTSAVKSLWEKNEKWLIEIDKRILNPTFITLAPKELTAILIHEIGHIVDSNAIPTRVSNILSYQLARSPFNARAMLSNDIFKKVLSLPVLNACIADKGNSAEIKHEIKADKFVKKVGYGQNLKSALSTLMRCKYYPKSGGSDDEMRKVTAFSTDTLSQFQKRRDALVKNRLLSLKSECASPYLAEAVQSIYDSLFTADFTLEDNTDRDKIKVEAMHDKADKLASFDVELLTEGFLGVKKKLKKIDANQIDYIRIKVADIKTNDDKLMIMSYINSKIDLIDYYMSIADNPKISKKYIIPHTQGELEHMKKTLVGLKEMAFKHALTKPNEGLVIAWPKGYEG